MIVKEWTREEVEGIQTQDSDREFFDCLAALKISRHKAYRFTLCLALYGKMMEMRKKTGLPGQTVKRFDFLYESTPGHGKMLGYPIAIDNSVDGLIFEEYKDGVNGTVILTPPSCNT